MNETAPNSTARAESAGPVKSAGPVEPAKPAEPPKPFEPAAQAVGRHVSKKTWFITASYTISGAIFAWSIALSMSSTTETAMPASSISPRDASPAVTVPPEARRDEAQQTTAGAKRERSGGDDYRAQARALDREFLRRQELRRQQRRQQQPHVPSHREAQEHWQAQVDRLREQLKHHPNPRKDSLLWGQKQQLEQLLADPPQQPASGDLD